MPTPIPAAQRLARPSPASRAAGLPAASHGVLATVPDRRRFIPPAHPAADRRGAPCLARLAR